jgi:addiction module HigA family antidote
MTNSRDSKSLRDWVVHPGEILKEALEERGMTQSELARRMDRPIKTVNEIIHGKTALTPDTAIQLERTLGISASFWNGVEVGYRESLAERRAELDLAQEAEWLDGFPVKDLARFGVIAGSKDPARLADSLLSFFRVANSKAWERNWLEPVAAFRSSPASVSNPKAVAAWLQWGRVEAEKIRVGSFMAANFLAAIREVRGMTDQAPLSLVIPAVQDICATAGVSVILTPELDGTRLSGATHWLTSSRAIIQLSLRHKTDDQFWFTFFHECAHVLSEDKGQVFVDDAAGMEQNDAERRADEFSRTILIPDEEWRPFVGARQFSPVAIRTFAKSQRVAPGIVVGRLQREGFVPRGNLNDLKSPLRWS